MLRQTKLYLSVHRKVYVIETFNKIVKQLTLRLSLVTNKEYFVGTRVVVYMCTLYKIRHRLCLIIPL